MVINGPVRSAHNGLFRKIQAFFVLLVQAVVHILGLFYTGVHDFVVSNVVCL